MRNPSLSLILAVFLQHIQVANDEATADDPFIRAAQRLVVVVRAKKDAPVASTFGPAAKLTTHFPLHPTVDC